MLIKVKEAAVYGLSVPRKVDVRMIQEGLIHQHARAMVTQEVLRAGKISYCVLFPTHINTWRFVRISTHFNLEQEKSLG